MAAIADAVDRRINEHLNGHSDALAVTYEPVPEDQITDQDRADIKEALHDLATGNYSGPFATAKELQAHLDSLK